MTKPIHFSADGFSGTVSGFDALKARIADLKARYPDLVGKTCKVWVGAGSVGAAVFTGAPSAQIVIGA
jgi:hypothetical protein